MQGNKLKRVVVALKGSPGIGKSWSALLYLQHLLKRKEMPIVFESGQAHNDRCIRLFVVVERTWVVYKLNDNKLPGEWNFFPGKNVIIDPAQFASNENPQASVSLSSFGHIFIPVSPNNLHLGGTHKTAELIQLILSPWSLRELMVAWPLMVYDEKLARMEQYLEMKERVKKRYDLFGGLPRYLLHDSKADDREIEMTESNAKSHQKTLLTAFTWQNRRS
jgi:hypothetical protein